MGWGALVEPKASQSINHSINKNKTSSSFFFSVGLPVANATDVLQPCGLLYYP